MKKINLALGGGGTKGFAHIGVIRQLEKENFEISAIAGTSAGGIVGALYALGHSTKEIEAFAKQLDYSQMFYRGSGDAPSILGLGGLYNSLEEIIGEKTFKDIHINFAVTAVDIKTGTEIILNSGKITDAVKATTAIPGIFPFVEIQDFRLVDGGVLDPVPVTTARWLHPYRPVVAINLMPSMKKWESMPRMDIPPFIPIPHFLVDQFNQIRLGKAMHVFIDSMEITTNTIAELRLKLEKPDVVLSPDVHEYTMFDKVDIDELIELGEKSVLDSRDQLNELFTISSRIDRWFKPNHSPGRLLDDLVK